MGVGWAWEVDNPVKLHKHALLTFEAELIIFYEVVYLCHLQSATSVELILLLLNVQSFLNLMHDFLWAL